MGLYVVRVSSALLDAYGHEKSRVADSYVPVEAVGEAEACRRAVLWFGDNGIAVENSELLWSCSDDPRALSFTATKCLAVSADEMDFFLSLTQGLSTAIVIGRLTT